MISLNEYFIEKAVSDHETDWWTLEMKFFPCSFFNYLWNTDYHVSGGINLFILVI